MRTHCQLALEALKSAGTLGVDSFSLNKIIGTNYSPRRIHDLKRKGYDIQSEWIRSGSSQTKRYWLEKSLDKKPIRYRFIGNQAIAE